MLHAIFSNFTKKSEIYHSNWRLEHKRKIERNVLISIFHAIFANVYTKKIHSEVLCNARISEGSVFYWQSCPHPLPAPLE